MRIGINHRVVLLAALFAMLVVLGIASRIAAHEPGDVAYLPDLNRYRLIEAYQASRGQTMSTSTQENLKPLQSLFAYASSSGGVGKFTLFLEIK